MRKIFLLFSLILIFSFCKSLIRLDYEKRTKQLDLGMTKQEVINILGKDYYIDSLFETDEGKNEVLTYYDEPKSNPTFTLYFLNNKLKEFQKYIPPYTPQEVRVVKE